MTYKNSPSKVDERSVCLWKHRSCTQSNKSFNWKEHDNYDIRCCIIESKQILVTSEWLHQINVFITNINVSITIIFNFTSYSVYAHYHYHEQSTVIIITSQTLRTQVSQFLQFLEFSALPPSCPACLPRCLACSPAWWGWGRWGWWW